MDATIRKQREAVLRVLTPIEREVADCKKCRLSLTRHHTVFAKGNPLAELVALGEGPGEDEDQEGIPFCGKAGILLKRALEAIGRDESNTYFMNTVKCRPTETMESGWVKNRAPYVDELEACQRYTRRQLEALPNKKIVLALGSTALHWLLSAEPASLRIGSARMRFLDIGLGLIPAIATYHPSYLLRKENAEEKGKVYEDLKLVKKFLDGHIDISRVRLYRGDTLRDAWQEPPSDRPRLPEPEQRPGKLLPFQNDRYTNNLTVVTDSGEHAADPVTPGAPKPQFGVKTKTKKEKKGLTPALDLFDDSDDIPF